MKKFFKIFFERPELDGILLGLLIAALPLLFSDGNRFGAEYLTGELPEFDEWQFYFFAAIPVGGLLGAFSAHKFKIELFNGVINIFLSLAGGALTAAGLLIAGDLFFNRSYAAARFYGSGWLFICAMLISACGLTVLWKLPKSGGKDK